MGQLNVEQLGTVSHRPGEDRAAALAVCARACDVEDARLLLQALGLLRERRGWVVLPGGKRRRVKA